MDRLVRLSPTKAGAELNLSRDVIDNCRVVYQKIADGLYVFGGGYDPNIDYGEDCVNVPVSSVYDGMERWTAGKRFANVLGSGKKGNTDKGTYGGKPITWHELYNALGLPWEPYEEKDHFYDCRNINTLYKPGDSSYRCSSIVVGGHVIGGTEPICLYEYDNVYIVPICSHHNSKNVPHSDASGENETRGNGNGFYMQMAQTRDVVRMRNYLHLDRLP